MLLASLDRIETWGKVCRIRQVNFHSSLINDTVTRVKKWYCLLFVRGGESQTSVIPARESIGGTAAQPWRHCDRGYAATTSLLWLQSRWRPNERGGVVYNSSCMRVSLSTHRHIPTPVRLSPGWVNSNGLDIHLLFTYTWPTYVYMSQEGCWREERRTRDGKATGVAFDPRLLSRHPSFKFKGDRFEFSRCT